MNTMSPRSKLCSARAARAIAALSCAVAFAWLGVCVAGAQATTAPPDATVVTATLEQCITSGAQAERSATFTGEMNSIPGAARLSMRIDVEEREPGEAEFHPVSAPGLGVWRAADPKVKVYKYLKQVTNLSSPASYRGLVRFRWINARGHVFKRAERLTTRCLQPAPPVEPSPLPPSGGEPAQPTSGMTAPSA
jgi:hypothetical protein